MDEQCLFCCHFRADEGDDDGVGQCRRYPPTWVASDDDGGPYCAFALVDESASCGEFKRRVM